MTTKPGIRHFARRVVTKGMLEIFMENVICDTVTYFEHAKRESVTAMDMVYAIKREGNWYLYMCRAVDNIDLYKVDNKFCLTDTPDCGALSYA
ncbi:unnamed protein product [Thelazia callipaeda]|uniref:Histone H4 n=1 Tax=Thelazia callipaeda TaxID=103827 RepID=A0A0N5CRQ6_THECL|nr:unnamed protein product [Thelazia callipaeda]